MKVAVLGSGNGGHAVAFEFAKAGHSVYMYDFEGFPTNIKAISEKGGITSSGGLSGFQKIDYAGHDIQKTISDAELIMVVSTANAIPLFAKVCKPYVKKGQIFVMCPGSCFGAIEFKKALGMSLEDTDIIVAETSTLPYAVRVVGEAEIRVPNRLKDGYFIAALPSSCNKKVYDILSKVYPEMKLAKNVIKTALQNANPIIHPSIMLSNIARTENQEHWEFYKDGVTTGVGRIIQALDLDRIAIGKKFGIEIVDDPSLGYIQGYMYDTSYDLGYSKALGFAGILAPTTTDHRYFNEDVDGLCLFEDMAKHFNLEVHAITTVIDMASIVRNVDYRKNRTRTMESLGLSKYSVEELNNIL